MIFKHYAFQKKNPRWLNSKLVSTHMGSFLFPTILQRFNVMTFIKYRGANCRPLFIQDNWGLLFCLTIKILLKNETQIKVAIYQVSFRLKLMFFSPMKDWSLAAIFLSSSCGSEILSASYAKWNFCTRALIKSAVHFDWTHDF